MKKFPLKTSGNKTGWKSWRWHMSMYHGYRQFWMFGLSQEDMSEIHATCFDWCHKPERDIIRGANVTYNQLRESLGLNEPGR